MNNMPSFAPSMADCTRPIEDPSWLGLERRQVPGNRSISQRFTTEVRSSDIAYAEEWKLDHGIMVLLNFLT